jgi:hypothetical protein
VNFGTFWSIFGKKSGHTASNVRARVRVFFKFAALRVQKKTFTAKEKKEIK